MYCIAVTTISLVNVHQYTVTNFFSCDKTFNTVSDLKMYNTTLLIVVTMLYITSLGLNLFCNRKFVPFGYLYPFCPP